MKMFFFCKTPQCFPKQWALGISPHIWPPLYDPPSMGVVTYGWGQPLRYLSIGAAPLHFGDRLNLLKETECPLTSRPVRAGRLLFVWKFFKRVVCQKGFVVILVFASKWLQWFDFWGISIWCFYDSLRLKIGVFIIRINFLPPPHNLIPWHSEVMKY